MNRIYRSVWNEITRTFVAAAETVRGRGKPASSCIGSAPAACRAVRALNCRPPLPLALEQRFMFDGAAVADAAAAEAQAAVAAAMASAAAPVEVRAADPAKDGGKTEVVFVDTSVKDYKTLEAGIRDGVAIIEIDGSKDGLAQIAQWAQTHGGYDSIAILGHGAQATLYLGTTTLTDASLSDATVRSELATVGGALTSDGDLMLYGCDVAKGSEGEKFIADLATATGADVAASSDATGAASKGGDWVLEQQVGTVETSESVDHPADFTGLLAAQTINLSGAITSGSLSSGNFTISGLVAFKITSSGNFTVTQSGGWLCIEETSPANDFQIEISDPGANSEFHFVSLGINNLSSGGEPGYGAQLALEVANAGTSATSSVIDGMNTIDLGSYGIVSTKVVLRDHEQNGYAETFKVWLKDLVVDLGATIPAVTSITRSNPASATTNADSLTWQVTFSEDVKNVNAADFAISGSTATITNVTAVSASVYKVTASGGDLANLEGSVFLDLVNAQDIAGMTGTKLIDRSPTSTDQRSYDVSNSTLPSLTATAATPTYTENAGAVSLFSAVTATTNDTGQTFSGMELTVSNVSDGSSELLNVGGAEIALIDGNTGTFAGGSYAVSISGDVATVALSEMTLSNAAMGSLIGGVTYRDSSEAPTVGDRVISIASIRDSGAAKSTIATSIAATVGVVAINDAPTLSATGGAPTYTENGAAVDLFSNVSIGMVEAGQSIDRLTLTVSGLADGVNEMLSADGSSIVLADGSNGTTSTNGMSYSVSLVGDTATVTFSKTGGISMAAAQSLVDGLGYRNASEAPTASSRVVTLTGIRDTGGTSNGGVDATALSIASTVAVVAVNDAPVLDTAPSSSFTVLANTGAPVGAVGALVSSLTNGVTDVDTGALKGVAITAADATHGTWYYSTDGGVNWSAINTVSNSSALLLAADATTRVYFKPNSGWSGDENLSFRAWDQTNGSAGSKADASSNGGTTAFSSATDTAACHVPGLPAITSAAYDAATGVLTVTGTDLVTLAGANNDIVANRLTLTGEGGATYTLTDTANVDIASATGFTLNLSATDRAAINQLLNKNGTSSTSGTTFSLAAADDWAAGADAAAAIADTSGNLITASNVAVPTITSASYDAASGVLTVTGTDLVALAGTNNDIVANRLTLTGEGGATYALTTASVDIASGTGFSVALNAADRAAVNRIINRNGTSSTGGATFNLAAAEDWAAGADSSVTIADLTGNGICVSNVAVPAITSATYDAATGTLVVTGSGFTTLSGPANDVIANKLTLTGEGGVTYTLTDTANTEITSGTSFSLNLSATDRAAINQILNKNGTASTGGATFNLTAAEDWAAGADSAVAVADLTSNAITVSNVPVPSITNATYDSGSGTLVVTGTGLTARAGANNDIVANRLTLTGEGGASYTLTDTANVEIASATGFVLNLSATDQAAIALLINKGGTASAGGTTYNLAAAEGWAAGADPLTAIADLTGNAITAGIVPRITGVSSATADGAYKAGDTVSIVVNFNQNVTVTGTPTLTLETGAADRVVNYTSGSGTSTLTFSYTVQAGDTAADLDYVGANALALNGGSIVAASDGVGAILTLAAPGTANSLGAAKAIVIDTSAPTNTVAATHFSADSGTSSSDFITRTAAQTISGTLGSALATGEHVEVSLDNGATWTTATASPGSNAWSLAATLAGSNTLQVRVADSAGNLGAALSQAYVLDTGAPVITFSGVALSTDNGTSQTDFITNAAAQTISATLSSAPSGNDVVYGSLDNGATWINITSKVSGTTLSWDNVTLSASNTLKLKVSDAAGNDGAVASQAYTLDRTAPTATVALSNTSLAAGQSATVTITFSEAVSGVDTSDFTVTNGTLSGLSPSGNGVTWTATFTPSANVTDASNTIILNRSGVQDDAGNAGVGTSASANYAVLTARTLSYSTTTLAEAAANDGSITSTLTITLANETFSGNDGDALGTVSNVPAGLTAQLVKLDATHAVLSLSGKASAHANAQDLSNLTVSFADADFVGSPAAAVSGATTTLAIDFADPAAIPVPPVVVVTPPLVVADAPATVTTPPTTGSEVGSATATFLAPTSEAALGMASGTLNATIEATQPAALSPATSASATSGGAATGAVASATSPAISVVPSTSDTRATTTQSGGFQVAVLAAGAGNGSAVDGLAVNRGIADQSVSTGTSGEFAIPADAFAASSANVVVTLLARQSDGRPLPPWVSFDAASGTFKVQAPPDGPGELTIRVVARDAQGHEAVTVFKVRIDRAAKGDGQRVQPERPGRAALSEQLRAAARPHPALERLARLAGLRDAA